MPQQLQKGTLIALEGIDGSGKSTLAQNLFTMFQQKNINALLTKEPGATELGKKVRELVQTQDIPFCAKAEYLLFAADRAQHFAEVVIPALAKHTLIISDRMSDSSLAYQGYGNGLDLETLTAINRWTMNNVTPDITIFVRTPVAIALARAKSRGALSAYEKRESFLQSVNEGFEILYKNHNNVIIVDGTQPQTALADQCYKAIEQWLRVKHLL